MARPDESRRRLRRRRFRKNRPGLRFRLPGEPAPPFSPGVSAGILSIFLCLAFPLEAQETVPYTWRQAPDGTALGPPAAQAGLVTLVCDDGTLVSYSEHGKLLWKYTAPGRLTPYLTHSTEGISYICGTNGTLLAVNPAGRELWRKDLEAPISAPVMAGWDGRLFVFTPQRVRCFTAAGHPLWSRYLAHPAALPPRMDREGGVLLVLESRELVEISPFGRIAARPLAVAPRAALPLDPVPRTKDEPAPEGNPALIFTGDGGVFISRWGVPAEPLPALGGLALDGPALDGTFLAVEGWEDTAAVVLSSGRLHLFTVPGGDPLWSDETHLTGERDAGEVRIRHDGRGIYVLSTSGATGFTKDGRKRWLIRIKGAAAVPAFSDEGFLYSCGKDRTLYSYHLEERTGSARRSPYGKTPGKIYDTAAAGFRSSVREEDGVSFDEKDIRDRLAHIGQMIGAGTIGEEEPRFTAYLMELAGSAGVLPLWDRPSRPTPVVQPNYRIEALRYLGRLGSRETIPFLADLYQRDRDGSIKAAAAIGGIGTDPEGRALRAFSALVFPVELYQDAAVLTATAAATGALCRFSGPQSSSPGIRILAALRRGRHSRSVQARAQAELESLR